MKTNFNSPQSFKKKISVYSLFLLPSGLFLLGLYFVFCPFFEKVSSNLLFEEKKSKKNVLIDKPFWDSLSTSWSQWQTSLDRFDFSPDSLVRLSREYSVLIQQLQVLAEGSEYRFHATAGFNEVLQFIRAIECFSPDWTIERFDWITGPKQNIFFIKNISLRFNPKEASLFTAKKALPAQVESIQGRELVHQLERWIDFRTRHVKPFGHLKNNPFIIEPLIPVKVIKTANRCHLPPFKITGVIAGRIAHIQIAGEKKIYKLGGVIGNYRILKIESRRILFTCGQDTVSRFL